MGWASWSIVFRCISSVEGLSIIALNTMTSQVKDHRVNPNNVAREGSFARSESVPEGCANARTFKRSRVHVQSSANCSKSINKPRGNIRILIRPAIEWFQYKKLNTIEWSQYKNLNTKKT